MEFVCQCMTTAMGGLDTDGICSWFAPLRLDLIEPDGVQLSFFASVPSAVPSNTDSFF